MFIYDIEQGTEEWHQFRGQGIGGSDIASIIGVGYQSKLELWEQRMGLRSAKAVNPAMKRGTDLEDQARQRVCCDTGVNFKPCLVYHDKILFLRASLDGVSEDEKSVLEIKCPGKVDHREAINGCIPFKYYCQIQWQIMAARVEKGFYYSYDGENGVLLAVPKNHMFCNYLLNEATGFWKSLTNFTVPDRFELVL